MHIYLVTYKFGHLFQTHIPFLHSPNPNKEKGEFLTKVSSFMLLIPRRSASSYMPPIGTSGVLHCNTEPIAIGITLRSLLELTIEASEAALIGDTRQRALFYLETSPSTSVELFQIFLPRLMCLFPKI